ncbi:hypothetical protein PR048_008860 [Dryococelus australis]|uniref:C2H2-type domain-containing protein n=1 Tax=Dryococelus australis TaxID=614101 RepID=A0ABQ9HYA3_9NEOP|nr:hypothetical protein PR048_008860 [Dryococelus australis]
MTPNDSKMTPNDSKMTPQESQTYSSTSCIFASKSYSASPMSLGTPDLMVATTVPSTSSGVVPRTSLPALHASLAPAPTSPTGLPGSLPQPLHRHQCHFCDKVFSFDHNVRQHECFNCVQSPCRMSYLCDICVPRYQVYCKQVSCDFLRVSVFRVIQDHVIKAIQGYEVKVKVACIQYCGSLLVDCYGFSGVFVFKLMGPESGPSGYESLIRLTCSTKNVLFSECPLLQMGKKGKFFTYKGEKNGGWVSSQHVGPRSCAPVPGPVGHNSSKSYYLQHLEKTVLRDGVSKMRDVLEVTDRRAFSSGQRELSTGRSVSSRCDRDTTVGRRIQHKCTLRCVLAEKQFNVGARKSVKRSQRDQSTPSLVYGDCLDALLLRMRKNLRPTPAGGGLITAVTTPSSGSDNNYRGRVGRVAIEARCSIEGTALTPQSLPPYTLHPRSNHNRRVSTGQDELQHEMAMHVHSGTHWCTLRAWSHALTHARNEPREAVVAVQAYTDDANSMQKTRHDALLPPLRARPIGAVYELRCPATAALLCSRHLKTVHDKVGTFEINPRKISLPLPTYILTGALRHEPIIDTELPVYFSRHIDNTDVPNTDSKSMYVANIQCPKFRSSGKYRDIQCIALHVSNNIKRHDVRAARFALSGDGALVERGSVALIAPTLLDLKRGNSYSFVKLACTLYPTFRLRSLSRGEEVQPVACGELLQSIDCSRMTVYIPPRSSGERKFIWNDLHTFRRRFPCLQLSFSLPLSLVPADATPAWGSASSPLQVVAAVPITTQLVDKIRRAAVDKRAHCRSRLVASTAMARAPSFHHASSHTLFMSLDDLLPKQPCVNEDLLGTETLHANSNRQLVHHVELLQKHDNILCLSPQADVSPSHILERVKLIYIKHAWGKFLSSEGAASPCEDNAAVLARNNARTRIVRRVSVVRCNIAKFKSMGQAWSDDVNSAIEFSPMVKMLIDMRERLVLRVMKRRFSQFTDTPLHELPSTSGVKKAEDDNNTDYMFTEDPNELVDRLEYLLELQKRGAYSNMKECKLNQKQFSRSDALKKHSEILNTVHHHRIIGLRQDMRPIEPAGGKIRLSVRERVPVLQIASTTEILAIGTSTEFCGRQGLFTMQGQRSRCAAERKTHGQHAKVDCVYLSQTYSYIPKQLLSDNANVLVLFRMNDMNLRYVYDDHVNTDMILSEFMCLCNLYWKEKYRFLTIVK